MSASRWRNKVETCGYNKKCHRSVVSTILFHLLTNHVVTFLRLYAVSPLRPYSRTFLPHFITISLLATCPNQANLPDLIATEISADFSRYYDYSTGYTDGARSPVKARDFSRLQNVPTSPAAYPPFVQCVPGFS